MSRTLSVIQFVLGIGLIASVFAWSAIGVDAQLAASPTAMPAATLSKTLVVPGIVYRVKWSPDGSALASVDGFSLRVWNVQTWQTELAILDSGITSVVWSPDSKQIAVTKGDGQEHLIIRDAKTGNLLRDFRRQPSGDVAMSAITRSDWSPDGKYVATNGAAGVIVIWNTATGESRELKRSLYQRTDEVSWSPDSRKLLSRVAIWDILSGEKLKTLDGGLALAWSPKDNKVALSSSQDRTAIQILDATTGDTQLNLFGHTDTVTSIAWSIDGRFLVSGSVDQTAIVWDAFTGKRLFVLKGHTQALDSVTWSPNEKQVASGGDDHTIRVWNLE